MSMECRFVKITNKNLVVGDVRHAINYECKHGRASFTFVQIHTSIHAFTCRKINILVKKITIFFYCQTCIFVINEKIEGAWKIAR